MTSEVDQSLYTLRRHLGHATARSDCCGSTRAEKQKQDTPCRYLLFAIVGICVSVLENDMTTGFTGSIATLGNVGPGLGPIGPMGGFVDLTLTSKLLLVFSMWAGRLELVAVLVLFHPDVWRGARWRPAHWDAAR